MHEDQCALESLHAVNRLVAENGGMMEIPSPVKDVWASLPSGELGGSRLSRRRRAHRRETSAT